MKIGFIQPYSATQYLIYSWHPSFELIPDSAKKKMPDWVPLPDNYEHGDGTNLIDKLTGEVTSIPIEIEPTIKSDQDIKIENIERTLDAIIISLLGV